MAENPLKTLLGDWLPEIDFGVMAHGFAPHGRDYVLILQAGATYEVTLTHVVEAHYETRVGDDVWPRSWDDVLTDYAAWEAAGAPDGYVWGSNWSLAYPGVDAPDEDPVAENWATRIGKPMYAASIETDRFKLSVVFHAVRAERLSDDSSVVRRVLNPMPPVH
ncbi:MAG TPA: hypothetical protein VGG29_04340 [Caulobacteraceae bacterium]